MGEEDAFWVMTSIMQYYGVGGLYRDDLPILSQFEILFDKMLHSYNPKVAIFLDELGFLQECYLTGWLTTLFVYRLPHPVLVKVKSFCIW